MASISNFDMDPSLMRDLRHALASSHAQNHLRTPVSTRKWNSRIEKSHSTHTSPARESRRRAWSGVPHIQQQFVPVQNQGVNHQTMHPMVAEHQQRPQRPLSWHATAYPMPSYTSSPTALATEQYPTSSYADFVPRTYSTTYPTSYDSIGYPMNSAAMPETPSSTLVYPNISPIWQDDNVPMPYTLNNYPQTYHIPTSMDNYHQSLATESVDQPFKQDTQTYYSTFSSYHPPEPRIVSDDYELEEEEEGEVLVALGLYDDAVDRTQQHPMKLTETWTPPPSESVQSDTES